MELGLSDKVVLVTGAGQGIGRAIGLHLANEGARVAFHYHDSKTGAEEAVAACERNAHRAVAIPYDLEDLHHVGSMVAHVEEALGPIDVLINNAAWTQAQPFLQGTPEDYLKEFTVTVFATMALTRVVLQKMVERQQGGTVVTVAGDAGRIGESRLAVTAAARAAEMAFAKSIAKEFGRHRIRSNVVSLGLVEKADAPLHFTEAQRDRLVRLYPAGRFGHVEDIPPLVALLASDRGAWITGQVISINGGYSMA
jgi:NAD(P)-dependent dehydrogenase (short-subunit alcohol dehydrogenase family)